MKLLTRSGRVPPNGGATPSTLSDGQPLLLLRNIRARYGAIEVLHGVDLAVNAGQVSALLGRNGSGKTTLLKVMAGLLAPATGDVVLAGRRVNGVSPVALARAGLCTIPEGRGIFPNLTVKENLVMMTYGGASRRHVEERAFAHFPRLAERREQLAGSLSGGEQQMLALARAIGCEPSVLLLDELSMGLAPKVVDALYDAIRRISAGGTTIVIVEQFAATVLGIADTAAVISQGRIVLSGAAQAVAGGLSTVYLGEHRRGKAAVSVTLEPKTINVLEPVG